MSRSVTSEISQLRIRNRLFSRHPQQFPASVHWQGQKFVNLDSGERRLKSVVRWLQTRRPSPWPVWEENAVFSVPEPVYSPQLQDWNVCFINHASVLWQLGPYNLLTDPVYAERVSPFRWAGPRRVRAPGVALAQLPTIHVILLSHNHYDHMDLATLGYLSQRDHPLIITGLGNAHYMRPHGIHNIVELDWWQVHHWNTLKVHFVPSQHFSGRGVADRDQSLWGGFVVDSPGGTGYFAGDTGWGRHFQEIAERWSAFRLGLLPIGAYEPRWFMRLAHINPEEAVRAHQLLKIQHSVAIHHHTFQLTDEPMQQPAEDLAVALMQHQVPAAQFWVLKEGESRRVP